jgi:hypothetical protein
MTEVTERPGGVTHELEGVLVAATDAVTDDMVGRLAETVSDGVALLDSLNRSGISKALPVLTRMVENGDLERIAQLARLLGAMEDAVTDDMVGRFADLAGDWVMVLDRLNRSGVGKLIDVLDRLNNLGALDKMAERLPALVANLELVEKLFGCLGEAAQQVAAAPPSRGGLLRLLRIAGDAQNQRSIEFALALSRRIQRQFE